MIPALYNLIKHTSSLKMHLKNAVWFALLFFCCFLCKNGFCNYYCCIITTVMIQLLLPSILPTAVPHLLLSLCCLILIPVVVIVSYKYQLWEYQKMSYHKLLLMKNRDVLECNLQGSVHINSDVVKCGQRVV